MPTVFEEYSLTEVAKKLKVADAWVRRWEKSLEFKGSSGQQGKRSFYTQEFIDILNRIHIIQILGFNNRQILRLWKMELSLKKLNGHKGFSYPLIIIAPEHPLLLDPDKFKDQANRDLLKDYYNFDLEIHYALSTLESSLKAFSENRKNNMDEIRQKQQDEVIEGLGIHIEF